MNKKKKKLLLEEIIILNSFNDDTLRIDSEFHLEYLNYKT